MHETTIELQIPSIEGCYRDPLFYEVSHGLLGWTLEIIGGNCSMCITEQLALDIIKLQKDMLKV